MLTRSKAIKWKYAATGEGLHFVANKRKVLLLGLRLMLAILTVEAIEFKQQSNYDHVGYETVLAKLHSGSCEQAS